MAYSRRMEIKTIRKMITLYCNATHKTEKNQLCLVCLDLYNYAEQRIDRCIYGDKKPVCSKCRVHCYKPEMRIKIKEVMQYSGPRMLLRSPILSSRYMYRKILKSNVSGQVK